MNIFIRTSIVAASCLVLAWVSLPWFHNGEAHVVDVVHATVSHVPGSSSTIIRSKGEEVINGSTQFMIGESLRTEEKNSLLTFPGGAIVRLGDHTKVTFLAESESLSSLVLEEGQIWVNTTGAHVPLTLIVPGGVIAESNDSSVNIEYRDRQVRFFAATRPTRVGFFIPDAIQTLDAVPDAINSVLVAQQHTFTVSLSKIQPKLEKLLYSKLVKEFQYLPLSEVALKENTWFRSNYAQDNDRREFMLKRVLDNTRKRGLIVSNPKNLISQITSFIGDLREKTIVRPRTKLQYQIDRDLIHLDDIIYYFVTSQDGSARDRAVYFSELLAMHASDQVYMKEVDRALTQRFETYSVAIPQDTSPFKVRNFLRKTLLDLSTLGYELPYDTSSRLVRSYLSDVYQSYSYDDATTQELIASYFSEYKRLFNHYKNNISEHSSFLAEENQLLGQLYLLHPIFYKEHYLKEAFALQSQWLDLLPEGRDKSEEQQTLVAAKIDLMKRLRFFFFSEKISVTDASFVLFRLLSDISIAAAQTDTAVAQYFKDSIRAQEDFLQYLSHRDFADSKLYGGLHKQRFTAFLKHKKDLMEIDKIQEGLLGTLSTESTEVKETVEDIEKKFALVGVTKLVISPLLDKDQVQVFIESAEYNSIPFSGIYDRDRSYVSDLKVYNETILSAAIPLSKIKSIFKVKPQDPLFTAAPEETVIEENPVEKVAKLFLLKKLKEIGFVLELESVTSLDYSKKIFQILSAVLPFEKSEIKLSFVVDLMDNTLKSIKVTILDIPVPMPGSLPLSNATGKIQNFYQEEFLKAMGVKEEMEQTIP